VEVRLESGNEAPYLVRRFESRETREIRLYLHGGDDRAVVVGNVRSSIPLIIVGGNGTNTLIDSSTVGGRSKTARLYDLGTVTYVSYKRDTVDRLDYDPDTAFNRRPWLNVHGEILPPQKDYGTSIRPVFGIKTGHGLGIVPKVGLVRYQYGFREFPYRSMARLEGAYATGTGGLRIGLTTDNRFEDTRFHVTDSAQVSQLEVVQFHGFGNDVPDRRDAFFDVKQTQWLWHPAASISLGAESDIALGPVVKYTVTDSLPGYFISELRPYGFGSVGQAGVQLDLRIDTRDNPDNASRGFAVEVTGAAFPGLWGLSSSFEEIAAVASTYLAFPVWKRPVLAVRAGGKKLFGDFPYYEAAFIGGSRSVRTFHHHQFAGDASLYGTTELRVPVGKVAFILPWDVGLLGFMDAGRVYMNGESPGGWHSVAGGGFWLGVLSPATGVTVAVTNRKARRLHVGLGFNF
jgi:hypothetical protein